MNIIKKIFYALFSLNKFFKWHVICPLQNLWFHFYLYIYNVEFGDSVKTLNGIVKCVFNGGRCIIGDNVSFNNYANAGWYSRCSIIVRDNGFLRIDNNVGINGCEIVCENSIHISQNVMIGGGTRIYDTNFHPIRVTERLNPLLKNRGKTSPVMIEENVFIGTNCIILKGVTIGRGAVIAAGSVVIDDIPSDCIAGGNPCKLIRQIDE